jgi:hypothetical protein
LATALLCGIRIEPAPARDSVMRRPEQRKPTLHARLVLAPLPLWTGFPQSFAIPLDQCRPKQCRHRVLKLTAVVDLVAGEGGAS